jgi:predicted O-methyltransferase YrrM
MSWPDLRGYHGAGRPAVRLALRSAAGRRMLRNRVGPDLRFLYQAAERAAALSEVAACHDLPAYLALARRQFSDGREQAGPTQLDAEILGFLAYARAFEPRRAVEIGTQSSGTTFLLANALPTMRQVVGVDLLVGNRARLRGLTRPDCDIQVIDGSSSDLAVFEHVRQALDGEPIDLLFIDGDHTFGGAAGDFMRWRTLVRDDGLIAFHDIVPDRRFDEISDTEFAPYAGEVPLLWDLLRRQYRSAEFVQSWTQKGLGIGALEYDTEVWPRLGPHRGESDQARSEATSQ